jgi:predicted TIM-barrel fold metal-dependent hydrolase
VAEPAVITHPQVDPAWLARLREDILEPDLPIVDPHHHLWERGGRYFLDELLADTGSGHNVVATVFVQCHYAYRTSGPEELRPVGETEFVTRVAEEAEERNAATRACAGIVGFADLQLGERVDSVLQAHVEAAGGRFRGVRRLTARDPAFKTHLPMLPPHMLSDPAFRQGFARLAKFGLSYDAWVYHPQIAEVTDLARAFPEVPIVLDHAGTPLGLGPYRGRQEEVFRTWRADMAQLAKCANVHVKLGGLAMVFNGFDFHEAALPPSSGELALRWRPYIESCIELFGVRRCMFESNFPVDKAMVSYSVLWNAFKRLAAGASADEKAALFHDTAAGFYRPIA